MQNVRQPTPHRPKVASFRRTTTAQSTPAHTPSPSPCSQGPPARSCPYQPVPTNRTQAHQVGGEHEVQLLRPQGREHLVHLRQRRELHARRQRDAVALHDRVNLAQRVRQLLGRRRRRSGRGGRRARRGGAALAALAAGLERRRRPVAAAAAVGRRRRLARAGRRGVGRVRRLGGLLVCHRDGLLQDGLPDLVRW
jgi:hypothetical protein